MSHDPLSGQLALFLDSLECGSFSAAARRHQLTPSAVARRIDALERQLGSPLFQRSTHALRATPAGLAFAVRARRILDELQLARAEAVSLGSAGTRHSGTASPHAQSPSPRRSGSARRRC